MLLSLVGYWAFGPMVYEPSTTNVQNPIDWIYRWICWCERHTASLNGHKPQVALSNIAFSMPCCSIFSSNMLYIWNITCCAITRAASSCFVIKIICLSRAMASERSCVCARARANKFSAHWLLWTHSYTDRFTIRNRKKYIRLMCGRFCHRLLCLFRDTAHMPRTAKRQ